MFILGSNVRIFFINVFDAQIWVFTINPNLFSSNMTDFVVFVYEVTSREDILRNLIFSPISGHCWCKGFVSTNQKCLPFAQNSPKYKKKAKIFIKGYIKVFPYYQVQFRLLMVMKNLNG